MKGKCKKILSLVLALAMVVQLFAGLGEVVKAANATQITVKGLGGWSATYTDTGTEQIGFEITGTITGGDSWPDGTISGDVLLNGEASRSWRMQATGASSFVLVSNGYQPTANDTITIPAGTQLICNGTAYEITSEHSIKYYQSTWHDVIETDQEITINGIGGWSATYTDTGTEQIGFEITGTITGGDSWPDGTISGDVLLNGEASRSWRMQATGASSFVLVSNGYQPTANDTITIPAGTQLICNGTVYEITGEHSIKYDGTTWSDVVSKIPLVLGALNDTTSQIVTGGQGYVYQICIATNQPNTVVNWDSGTDTTAEVYLNNADEPINGTALWNTTSGELFVQIDLPTSTVVNTITIKKGTEYTILEKIYQVTSEDYTVYCYDGDLHSEPKEEATSLTLGTLNDATTRIITGGQGYVYQIGIATNQTNTVVNWDSGTDTTAEVYLNGDTQPINATALWNSTSGELFVQLDLPTSTVVDTITIKKGTEYTILGTTYEVISEDYTIYCYDNDLHAVPKPEAIQLTLGEMGGNTRRITGGQGYLYQLCIATNQTDTVVNWDSGTDTTAEVYLNGSSTPTNGTALWNTTSGEFYLQLDLAASTVVNTITIKKGTEYTILGTTYEVLNEDYTIYHKDGLFSKDMLYDITKTVDGVITTETVSGDYTLPEASKEGYIALGWDVDGELYKVGEVLPAKLAGYTIKAVNVAFSQLDGAQVRLSAPSDEKIGGIRFVCRLGSDSLSTHIVEMGMLVMPTNYMTNGEFTHENYESQAKRYREFVVAKDDMELEVYEQDKTANGAQYYYLKGSIVNLYDYNYTRSYSARSFLKVQYHDGVDYLYTDYNEDNNERRICDVAKKMIETYPEDYSPAKNKTYPIVYEYAKVADTMESFAFFGPQVVVTNDAYDVAATKEAMQNYANAGFKYLLMEGDGYHVDNTFGTTTLEEEQQVYDNPRLPKHNLKQTMHLAKECGLEVIVLDWSLVRLSESDIALVSDNPTEVLAMCLQTTDGQYPTLIGSTIDENLFDEANKTYIYDGQAATVLHYVKQFASYVELKEWVAIKMSAYAKEPNFRGVRLDDEPTTSQYDAVVMMTKVIKELYPKAYVQSSNLQSYSKVYNSDYDTWRNAWNTLLSKHIVATEVGINFYPFRKDSDFWSNLSSEGYELQSNYLRTLQELATTTQNKGLDLELTIQSYATKSHYHTVSENRLALQTHLALAFGTKTLGYFRYTGTGDTEPEANSTITQTIDADSTLQNAVLYANKNGNYLKAHMTFFDYKKSKVFGSGSYVSTSGLKQEELTKNIITVPNGATVLVNEFYNEHTSQYGYYVVNLAQLHNISIGYEVTNSDITITLSKDCLVYKDYNSYKTEETSRVKSVTLSDGQGAFIVVED